MTQCGDKRKKNEINKDAKEEEMWKNHDDEERAKKDALDSELSEFDDDNKYTESNMKKLNITKKKFNESKYFQKKYGKLEYVSESGKLYKTTKGKILKFNESEDTVTCAACENEVPASDVEYLEGHPLCSKCREGGVHESSDDIDNDPAYECPNCGSHNCEFDEANEPSDYFDGSTLTASYYCLDCGTDYDVTFELKVKDVNSKGKLDDWDSTL